MDLSAAVYDPLSLTQIIGYIAAFCGILAFLQHDDRRMKILLVFQAAFLVAHFGFLGAYTGMFAAVLAGSRAGLSIFDGARRRKRFLVPVYFVLTVCLGWFSYQNPVDLLPLAAAVTGVIAFFYLHGIRMRLVLSIGTCFWLAHNIMKVSYGPIVMESTMLIVQSVTIWRMMRRARRISELADAV
ncbi:MAG: YgjV family protein [Bdellovibrionales bacterium]